MMDAINFERTTCRSHHHTMPFGPCLLPAGGVLFRLWAPGAEKVELALFSGENQTFFSTMEPLPSGFFHLANTKATVGSLYQFRINGDLLVPDPASRFQPCDIHGPSQVISAAEFDWQNSSWKGRSWEEAVFYELHVGAFSSLGTFAGIERRLDYLAELGITAIELMPVADFPGQYNWGYDGALLFAPDSTYGHPDDLRRLIRSAHQKGLMVFLDVVYNHFGPEGNYLHVYAKDAFFQQDRHTPWGTAVNFSGPESRSVRDFYIHNALYWLEEFQLDGLRFDAVHGIHDDSRPHILEEIAEAVALGPGKDREIHLVLENDKNEVRYLTRNQHDSPRHYTAQWNDDIHHALHVLLTSEKNGYYRDYADYPLEHLGRCLTQGFSYQGEPSPYRNNECRGEPSFMLPPTAFVSFLQNHDQIGNRAFGERLTTLTGEKNIRLAAALLLLAPSPPLLFMGEEFFAKTPFYFFCDFQGDLAEAVSKGRRREFSGFSQFSEPDQLSLIPDPNTHETFQRSCLNWQDLTGREGKEGYSFYKKLLALRKKHVIPRLHGVRGEKAAYRILGPKAIEVWWTLADDSQLTMLINFSENPVNEIHRPPGSLFFAYPEINVANWPGQSLCSQSLLCFLGPAEDRFDEKISYT